MRDIVGSIELELRRYKALGEGALQQLRDDELAARAHPTANSAATLVWHMSGNLQSRFTDFLASDGEKPCRQPLTVHAALHRSLAHTAYHTGQLVYLGKTLRGDAWQYMTIPPGKTAEYNDNPTLEKGPKRV